MDEKPADQHVVSVDDDLRKNSITKEENVHSVALAEALASQKPSKWSPNMRKLYAIMGIGYLVSTLNGFDSSLMVRTHNASFPVGH